MQILSPYLRPKPSIFATILFEIHLSILDVRNINSIIFWLQSRVWRRSRGFSLRRRFCRRVYQLCMSQFTGEFEIFQFRTYFHIHSSTVNSGRNFRGVISRKKEKRKIERRWELYLRDFPLYFMIPSKALWRNIDSFTSRFRAPSPVNINKKSHVCLSLQLIYYIDVKRVQNISLLPIFPLKQIFLENTRSTI